MRTRNYSTWGSTLSLSFHLPRRTLRLRSIAHDLQNHFLLPSDSGTERNNNIDAAIWDPQLGSEQKLVTGTEVAK